MKIFVFFVLLVTNFKDIQGGFYTKCDIEGVDEYEWFDYFLMKKPINDTHEGLVATFKTHNILRITKQESIYLRATYSDETFSFFTNERFKKFEEEYKGNSDEILILEVTFDCTDNKSETLKISQKVKDINNHDPVLNRDKYEYHFGMYLPANYRLTKFLPISASDSDFSNKNIYFTMDYTEDIIISYFGKTKDYYNKHYVATLKTLKKLKAPFRKEYTLVATDGGDPSRNTTALLVVNLRSNDADENENIGSNENNGNDNESSENSESGEGNETFTHPPVFAKHLYFANYTSDDDLKMDEAIIIKYASESDTSIKQSGYADYFKIDFDPKIESALQVNHLSPLPETIVKSTILLVIEIEAENKGLIHVPGRTALVIRLPNFKQSNSEENSENYKQNSPNNCSVSHVENSLASNKFVLSFMTVLFMIVIVNVSILAWQLQDKRVVTMQYPCEEKMQH